MDVVFLEAQVPLTKKYTTQGKQSYPNAYEFTSHEEHVKNLPHLADLIALHAERGHCLLKGRIKAPLVNESRAGSTYPDASTSWVCLDIDGLTSVTTLDTFMDKIGLGDLSYVYQYSASYGVYGDFSLRAHVFIFLKQPVTPTSLKLWLKQINLRHFSNELTLTKTNVSLRWGLDITTCQNDKLLYITPPTCIPPSLNEFTLPRIGYIARANHVLDFTTLELDSPEVIRLGEEAIINTQRRLQNLTERKAREFKLKEYKGEAYLPNPDAAVVTAVREDRGFVYFNLNGGDSWGYYHPVDNPTFIHNFKGEPKYKTSELIPDYWQSLQSNKQLAKQAEHKTKTFFAFREFRTAEYYNGWYDHSTFTLELHPAKNEKQVNDFLIHYGQFVPETLPIWSLVYDPFAKPYDTDKRTINLFQPSEYMRYTDTVKIDDPVRQAMASLPPAQLFPTIHKLVEHVIGPSMASHFYNWLAFCYQQRKAPQTAWVLHGTQGTGKGLLMNRVIAPLFGKPNVTMRRMEELEDKFNGYLENSSIIFIDEAQISESGRNKVIMANLKNWITEPQVTVRHMRQSSYEVPNRSGWIFASNMPDPVVIAGNDRRFNVGEFQPRQLVISDSELDSLATELGALSQFMACYVVDAHQVRTARMNVDKERMIQISRSAADAVAEALLNGDLTLFWDALPTIESTRLPLNLQAKLESYRSLLYDIITSGRTRISRDELGLLFDFNVGGLNLNAWKLTSYLRHHGINVVDMRMGGRVVKGIDIVWTTDPQWLQERKAEIFQQFPKLQLVNANG